MVFEVPCWGSSGGEVRVWLVDGWSGEGVLCFWL